MGLSVDTLPSLRAWAQGLGGIAFPLMSDFHPHGKASESLGIFNAESGNTRRSVTVIDKEGTVRWFQMYQPGTIPDPKDVLEELAKLQR